MAVSGLIMVGFLIAHMLGNLKLLSGAAHFNAYAHGLRTLGEPLLPYSGALWLLRPVLIVAVIAHIWAAFALTRRSRAAIGQSSRYQSRQNRGGIQRTYASRTMRWGGVIVLLFVIYHLLHFTFLPQLGNPGTDTLLPGSSNADPFGRTVAGFQVWWVVVFYTIAIIAVGFHLRHGIWSSLTTLGANTSARARRRLNTLAVVVTAALVIGFLIPPYAVLLGVVQA